MTKSGNVWAIGYDDVGRDNQVRNEIVSHDSRPLACHLEKGISHERTQQESAQN